MSDFKLYRGDCLEIMPTLAAGSVDMVMCDLPYGTTACKWDSIISFDALWLNYRRLIKANAAIVLTASQPFTSALVMSNADEFKYQWVWEKGKATGHLNAARMPLKKHEDVLIFYREQPTYNPQGVRENLTNSSRPAKGQVKGEVYGNQRNDYAASTLGNYPKSVIQFSGEHKPIHPTQKPVALMEYLIRTYTNEGETVLDNCMGSGTTGVACMQSGRNFIGIELNDYAQAAALRILKAWGGDTMRTIYATPYNDETKQATGPSTDSGFVTIAEVVEAMGSDWLTCSGRAVVYPGVMFSDYGVAL